jgi:hypothetical protein
VLRSELRRLSKVNFRKGGLARENGRNGRHPRPRNFRKA